MNRSITRMGLFLALAILTLPIAAQDFGAAGALARDTMTMEEMIVYEWGIQRPFSNIIRPEERHIASLLPLFDRYEVELPEDTAGEHVIMPASRQEAFEQGLAAETRDGGMRDGGTRGRPDREPPRSR